MKTFTFATTVAAAALMSGQAALADAHLEEITVAYFLEWPMPMLAAKHAGTYAETLGVSVNWVSFDTGTAMSAAMASGDVQLSVSQGVPPFVIAASAGQDIQVVDVAVSYSENDNCVAGQPLGVTKDNATDLNGTTVAVPLGTAAHYGFLRQVDHFGIDLASLNVVDMAPAEGAAALSQGAVDWACGFGGGLNTMKEAGNVLLTGAEKEELGILVFDVTSAPAAFVAENPELVAKFLKVTADANAEWAETQSEDMLKIIAQESGQELEAARGNISTFTFPTVEEQLSEKWLGGNAATFMKGVADVFVEAGSIPSALGSYADTVNTGPLSDAAEM